MTTGKESKGVGKAGRQSSAFAGLALVSKLTSVESTTKSSGLLAPVNSSGIYGIAQTVSAEHAERFCWKSFVEYILFQKTVRPSGRALSDPSAKSVVEYSVQQRWREEKRTYIYSASLLFRNSDFGG